MQDNGIKYEFTAKPWQYSGKGAWYFVSMPAEQSAEIRANLRWAEEGWGRLKALAEIGNSQWKTAIWFDSKSNTYLLPLKAEIRKRENLEAGKVVEVRVWV